MSSLSTYMRNTLADYLLRGVAYTPPTSVWVGLHTTDPSPTGLNGEVVGGNYARVQITHAQFTAATSGVCALNANRPFPVAGADWGILTHLTVWDAQIAGNCLYYGVMAAPKTINTGDSFRLPANIFGLGFR